MNGIAAKQVLRVICLLGVACAPAAAQAGGDGVPCFFEDVNWMDNAPPATWRDIQSAGQVLQPYDDWEVVQLPLQTTKGSGAPSPTVPDCPTDADFALLLDVAPLVDCLADLNGDGVVDAGDLGVFITAYLAGDLLVDFTGDGLVDAGDLGLYITAYLDGC